MVLSVIIPTCGRLFRLESCLLSLLKQTVKPTEIIVVDNTSKNKNISDKGLIGKIQCLTDIKLIYLNEKNKGAAFGRNAGISKARGKILAFLDDDCTVDGYWIENILIFHKKHPGAILVGHNIIGPKNNIIADIQCFRTKKRFVDTMYEKEGIVYCKYVDTKNFAIPINIIKRDHLLFDAISGFSIFSACEDIDLSIRAKLNNIPMIYCHKMIAYHFGVSTLSSYIKREFIKGRAYYYFKIKWPKHKLEKSKLSILKGLLSDGFHSRRNLSQRLLLLMLFLLGSLSHKLGTKYEFISDKLNINILLGLRKKMIL